MNWVVTSLLMFLSSIVYYLVLKLALNEKVDNKLYMVANFFFPAILFLIINTITKTPILIPLKYIIILITSALVFSYIGSRTSYTAQEYISNPGYSLVIQKSYAIYTWIASIFLFQGEFSLRKFLAVIIVIFSAMIVSLSDNKKLKIKNSLWVVYSIIAFFCFGSSALINKYIFLSGVVSNTTILFWLLSTVFSISFFDLLISHKKIKSSFNKKNLFILLLIGLTATSFYFFKQVSEVNAPNVGYVSAINGSSQAFFTVVVALIFKDHLSWKKFAGVLGITAGILLIIL